MKRVVIAIVLLAAVGTAPAQTASQSSTLPWTDVRKQPVFELWLALKTAANGEQPSGADTLFTEEITVFNEFVEGTVERWGDFKGIELPQFLNDNTARIPILFEKMNYELTVVVTPENTIGENLKLTNAAPEETLSKREWSDLGDDTLVVESLTSLDALRDAFREDKGRVRLVSLLSPT